MARPTLFAHPKFRRLVFLLGQPEPLVLGCLEFLWHVAYESGEAVIGDTLDVELAAKWPGERGVFCKALLDVRFIDEIEPGRYTIHDLYDHAPDYVRKRMEREASRKQRYAPRRRPLTAAWRTDGELGGQIPPNGEHGEPNSALNSPPAPAPAPNNHLFEMVAPSPPPEASEPPPVLVFPCVPGRKKKPTEWSLSQTKLAEYRESFPGVDVLAELRKARQWCIDNPAKRKTYDGTPAFLTRWLGKAQDQGSRRGGVPQPLPEEQPQRSSEELLEQQRQRLQQRRERQAALAGGEPA